MTQRTVRIRWLGVAGIELVADGHTLLIDPFVTRPPWRNLLFGRPTPDAALVAAHASRADAVLVTHPHWDHLMDVPEVYRQTGATVYGSPNTSALLRALGVPAGRARTVTAGDQLTTGPFSIAVLPARHLRMLGRPVLAGAVSGTPRIPPRLRDYRMDCDYSFLIETGSMRLLDWSGEAPAAPPPADVLLVKPFAAGRPAYANLLRAVRPRLVVPIHWDDFFRPLSRPPRPSYAPPSWGWPPLRRVDLSAFGETTKRILPSARVLPPVLFQSYDIRFASRSAAS